MGCYKEIDFYHMHHCLTMARLANQGGEFPVGALLVDSKKQILAAEYNKNIGYFDPTAHAEILVIRKAAIFLKNYRLNKSYLYSSLEPCFMCMGGIVWGRIKKVFFGAKDHNLKESTSFSFFMATQKRNFMIQGGLLANKSKLLLKSFFKKKRIKK